MMIKNRQRAETLFTQEARMPLARTAYGACGLSTSYYRALVGGDGLSEMPATAESEILAQQIAQEFAGRPYRPTAEHIHRAREFVDRCHAMFRG